MVFLCWAPLSLPMPMATNSLSLPTMIWRSSVPARMACSNLSHGSEPRRDSPSATIGARRVKADVQGLGKVRIRLSQPIPNGAEVVRIHFVKLADEGHRVEARLVLTLPGEAPDFDELATGALIHAILRALQADAFARRGRGGGGGRHLRAGRRLERLRPERGPPGQH
jgi:hypothetical protein